MPLDWVGVLLTTFAFTAAIAAGRGTSANHFLVAVVGLLVGARACFDASLAIATARGGIEMASRYPSGTMVLLMMTFVPVGAAFTALAAFRLSRRFPTSAGIVASAVVLVGLVLIAHE